MRNRCIVILIINLLISFCLYAEETRRIENVDLDGDGKIDRISCQFESGAFKGYSNHFKLSINDAYIEGDGENIIYEVQIVDIDKNDNLKEILIPEAGPSDDYASYLYYYKNNKIEFIGKVEGADNLVIDGSGIVISPARAKIIQTWWYKKPYCLNAKHFLQEIPQDIYYVAGNAGMKVTVKKELPLKKYRKFNSEIFIVLKKGDEIDLIAHDNKEWVQVRTVSGIIGWVAIEGFDVLKGTQERLNKYLDGLGYAD